MKETEQKQELENPYHSRIELLATILEPVSLCPMTFTLVAIQTKKV